MNTQEFLLISHRGYGKSALPRYAKSNKKIKVPNTLTAFEMGIENGANALEIDLCVAADGEIVTHHLLPGASIKSSRVYLQKNPEALTLNELGEWFSHQDKRLVLYLELKSYIAVNVFVDIFRSSLDRVVLYSQNKQWIESLISEKQEMKFKTDDIKLSFVTNTLITKRLIQEMASFGSRESRVWAIEQGMMPWGLIYPIFNIKSLKAYIVKCIKFAHKNNILYLVGTINDVAVAENLIAMGINGIVPDDVTPFRNLINSSLRPNYYIPRGCKKRLVTKYHSSN